MVLIDESTISTGSVVETDVCVIGAGPAGISFAREFAGSALRVALLESGRFAYDEKSQSLGEGQLDSDYFIPGAIASGRRRQFGGTTNLWSYETQPADGRVYARSVPAEAIDLEPRAGQPNLCWPLTLDDLDPFYQRAQLVWNGGPFDYQIDSWASAEAKPIDTSGGPVESRICQHGPADVFRLRYRDDLLSAANVDVYLGCTGLALESDGTASVARRLRVARYDGATFSVDAKVFIVACGGVENVQLLLSSEMTQPGAIGNPHDNVGRYVTTHPEFRMGAIVPGRQGFFDELAIYDIRWVGRYMVSAFLTLAEDVKRSENLLNMSIALVPRGPGYGTEAHRALAALRGPIARRERPTQIASNLRSLLSSPRDAADALLRMRGDYQEFRGGWSRSDVDRDQFKAIELWAAPEQTAEADNRITLTSQRDWLGRNQVKLDWQWSQSDRDNIERSIDVFGSQIESDGLGRFDPLIEFDGPARPRLDGLHHPMGGTRMHVDPQLGVVDDNCLVHGLENVYVAGSSVFPTGLGYSNPTLTLLALALRVADRVKLDLAVTCSQNV